VCDDIDNDCDDYIDELPECPCPSQTIEGVEFHFCDLRFNWEEAAAFCAAQGHALARLDGEAQNAAVGAAARAIRDEWWWIGLNDVAVEGTFAWVDGAPMTFTRWGGGEPSATTPSHDCAQIRPDSNATWNDIACGNRGSFICRAAP
jgi:C-type mannose receptor